MKFCLINQDAGLGDIIFCQKIATKIKEKYNIPIIWPVIKEYLYIKDYILNDVDFVDKDSDFCGKEYYHLNRSIDDDNILYICLHNASINSPWRVMEAKYKLLNLEYEDWSKFFNFKRNTEKENRLYYDILKLKDDEDYTLINKLYASPPGIKTADFDYPKNVKNVEINFYEGISVFDWSKVLENANDIYTTDTCYILLTEKLNLKCKKLNIFSRRSNNWGEIDYLLSKDFNKLY